jgi:DNA phosphorothioation-dependent restriction protein DptH
MRTFSEGLIELEDRAAVTAIASGSDSLPTDSKGYLVLRTHQQGKNFRVFSPAMIAEVEREWFERSGEIGRWRVSVRASGVRAKRLEFVAFSAPETAKSRALWDRAANASRRLAERYSVFGGVGQIYDQNSKQFDSIVKEYLIAWNALFEESDPDLALVNTVEVQSLSGRTIGLIVLPAHPLRVAWHSAYDNLVLHTRFEQDVPAKQIRDELEMLDGAMFPAFLPGVEQGKSFVFADTLGFHAVGMVADDDPEPKAAMAILSRALGESDSAKSSPTAGRQSAQILGNEILKYLECHDSSKILQVHALRPGDGLTVARSLGHVQKRSRRLKDDDLDREDPQSTAPSFLLELYPSAAQRGVAGRFIAESREKRRSGAGVVLEEDQWMLESSSLPGGMTLPRLRWARKGDICPKTAAHLAVAFDTFDSTVVPEDLRTEGRKRPCFVFGLMSFFERDYRSLPSPIWRSTALLSNEGEKHPADKMHTDRLVKLYQTMLGCTVRNLGASSAVPILRTEISPEKADDLLELHRLCDWVITLDRNAGIEYFDSPRDNREIYDAYVIDCVPEREDLGCLQLITSTSNLDEVRNLLDGAFDRMGLSRSRRNAEFLLEHLKALSGRLAIRLTGQKAPTSELIALAMCHASCRAATDEDSCWSSLRNGFFIPIDDIRDLLPPVEDEEIEMATQVSEETDRTDGRAVRPDLIYVSMLQKKGLLLRFSEVKYRRHLRMARSPETLQNIKKQVETLRSRWANWYGIDDVPSTFQALRRAKLARVLRFYADKARRHADDENGLGLSSSAHQALTNEIDRMIEKGSDYSFPQISGSDRGWIFCPEYAGIRPLEITPSGWETRIFLFGPSSNFVLTPKMSVQNSPSPEAGSVRQKEGFPTTNEIRNESHDDSPDSTDESQKEQRSQASELETLKSAIENQECPSDSLSEVIPSISLGTSTQTGANVSWPLTVKGNPHLLIAGLPGMGKTTCLLGICRQMAKSQIQPIVFSYHQDIDEKLQQLVGTIRFIDFDGLGFNPLHVIDRTSRMAYLDVAGAVRDIFTAIFPELGDIQGERIRKAIKDSFIEIGWGDPNADLSGLNVPEFSRFVEILQSDPKPDRGLKTLLSRLEELADYGFFKTADQQDSLWDSNVPIIIRIHSTQNDNLQKAFASLVFYSLYKDMFRRGIQNRITHAVIFDEAHRAARLQLIPTMAKECRKYGISLVLASQEARDFNVSLFSAIANYLVLRLTEADAKALARNVAASDMEKTLTDRIKQLDRFKAFYCCEGQKKPVQVSLHS